jgi:hypothetical protein
MIKILFSFNLHNFGHSVSFDTEFSMCDHYLFYLLFLSCVHNLYIVKYYSIVDLYIICILY